MVMASTDTTSAQKCLKRKVHFSACKLKMEERHISEVFQFSGRIEVYFVFPRSHAVVDFFKLGIVGAQKLQGLGY